MRISRNKKYILFLLIMSLISCMTVSIPAMLPRIPESIVSIEFEEGDANVGPLDPEEPEDPGNGGTGESGSLAINHISHFYFEKQQIIAHVAEYPTTTQTPYIQVTDARGTGEGWTVSARPSKFTTTSGKESLFGATMVLKNPSYISPADKPWPPPPQLIPEVVFEFTGEALIDVVAAEENSGMGTWLIRWYTDPNSMTNDSVILNVPFGGGMIGENIAKITWILSSGPT